ncbi:hypothetical protein [Azospirillum argentinense]
MRIIYRAAMLAILQTHGREIRWVNFHCLALYVEKTFGIVVCLSSRYTDGA